MKRSRSRSQSSLGLVKYMLTPQEQTDDTYMNLRTSTRIFHLLYTFSTSSTNLFMLLPKVRRWAPQELRTCARDYCNSFWMRCSSKLPPALGRSLLLAAGTNACPSYSNTVQLSGPRESSLSRSYLTRKVSHTDRFSVC